MKIRRLTSFEILLLAIIVGLSLYILHIRYAPDKKRGNEMVFGIPVLVKIDNGDTYQAHLKLMSDKTVEWILGQKVQPQGSAR